jgi:hypothetical protein
MQFLEQKTVFAIFVKPKLFHFTSLAHKEYPKSGIQNRNPNFKKKSEMDPEEL